MTNSRYYTGDNDNEKDFQNSNIQLTKTLMSVFLLILLFKIIKTKN